MGGIEGQRVGVTFVGHLVAVPFTFQNRPPVAAEPLSLNSGDIEAVDYPRMPAFPQPPMRPEPARPRQATRAPAPSPSLAPVAMNAVRGRADSTVPPPPARGSAPEMVVRTRPSLKAGFGILLAGAIVGSILGITTTPKQAVAAYPPATDFVNATTLPSAVKDELPPPAAKTEAKVDAPKDDAPAADETKPVAGKKKVAVARGAAVRTTVASAGPKPEKPVKAAKEDDSDDGYRVASADSGSSKSSAKKKPAPKDDEDDAPAPAPKKKPKASDDAASVLRAAMGATENTL